MEKHSIQRSAKANTKIQIKWRPYLNGKSITITVLPSGFWALALARASCTVEIRGCGTLPFVMPEQYT
jgi:hypothetical protein